MQEKAKSSSKLHTKSNKRRLITSVVSVIFMIAVTSVTLVNRQYLSDHVVALFYQPTVAVLELRDRIAPTDEGQRIFYATQPEVSDASTFNTQCPRQEVKNPILGCYTRNDRMYIFSINNSDLEGIEEVTAAHEMLHAVWARMNDNEREHITDKLLTIYKNVTDADLHERMAYYERTEPGEFANELHSIIGTEMTDVGPELETHYARYFQNRTQIVGYFQQYDTVYKALYQRADELTKQIEKLASDINTASEVYSADVENLSSDIDAFNVRANNGDFTSQASFYAERAALSSRSTALEAKRLAINADIEKYNKLFAEYNDVSSKIESLDKSLDSFQALEAIPSL